MNKSRGKKAYGSSEDDFSWNYFIGGHRVPELERGATVLVEYFGRNRVAIVTGKIPGGCYWAQLCAPVNGQTRVAVTKNSFKGAASNA